MANPVVLFSRGSSVNFPNVTKDPNTLYFITDTNEFYLGSEKYGFGKDITIHDSGIGDCVTGVTWDLGTKTLTLTRGDAGDLESVKQAIADAAASYLTSITTDSESALKVDSTDPANLVLSLAVAENAPEKGNVTFGQCSEGLYANVDMPEVPVDGVADNDKILALEGAKIKSSLTITTEQDTSTQKTYVVLKGIGGAEVSRFDATDFVNHGLLQSVKLEYRGNPPHPWIVMTFFVGDGTHTETIAVDVNDLVDVYTAATNGGLKMENNEFSIDNDVEASTGVNTDTEVAFGDTIALNTIQYNAKGVITGKGQFRITIPGLSGTVGADDNSKLVTFMSLDNTGKLTGSTIDVVTALSAASTDNQIPTAKSVWDAIDDAKTVWETFNSQ